MIQYNKIGHQSPVTDTNFPFRMQCRTKAITLLYNNNSFVRNSVFLRYSKIYQKNNKNFELHYFI